VSHISITIALDTLLVMPVNPCQYCMVKTVKRGLCKPAWNMGLEIKVLTEYIL